MALSKRLGWSMADCEDLSIDQFWDAWDTSLEWEKKAKQEADAILKRR